MIRPKGAALPASDPGLRRVSVHAGAAVADLALPASVPVGVLIPSIVDVLADRCGDHDPAATRYQLSLPGAPALTASTTLAQANIRDGAVLVLSRPSTPLPVPRYDDAAEAVSTALGEAGRSWNRRAARLTGAVAGGCLAGIGALMMVPKAMTDGATREPAAVAAASAGVIALLCAAIAHRAYRDPIAGLTLSVIAVMFAAAAGFVAVPGAPGFPHVLLAATAAAATSVVAVCAAGCGVVTLTAVSCAALIAAVAALGGVLTGAPPRAVGAASALVSVGLLGMAARASIVLAGLSPHLPPAPDPDVTEPNDLLLPGKARRADRWLSGLLAAFAWSAAAGAVVTVLSGAPRLCCTAFGALTGALLLLRARAGGRNRAWALVASGSAVLATTFGTAAARMAASGASIVAATVPLVTAAMFLSFVAPGLSPSPVARRSAELLEHLALAAMVPLACWVSGLYGAARALNFP